MTIYIPGDTVTARQLRGLLHQAGLDVRADTPARFHVPRVAVTITITEALVACPIVDGIDSDLERRAVNAIAELTPSGRILLQRSGGVQSDRALAITVSPIDEERAAVVTGLYRALRQGETPRRARPGWGFFGGAKAAAVAVLLVALPLLAVAQPLPAMVAMPTLQQLHDAEVTAARLEAMLIDRDQRIAELELSARAQRVAAKLRALLQPPADTVLDLRTATFVKVTGGAK
jgi:hypothetical protein